MACWARKCCGVVLKEKRLAEPYNTFAQKFKPFIKKFKKREIRLS